MKLHLRMKPYIQPFERELAIAELEALTGEVIGPQSARSEQGDFVVTRGAPRVLASRLSYWECVRGTETVWTRQVLVESTTNTVRNGLAFAEIRDAIPYTDAPPIPNRRVLRYGVHGIHEYRGKFFPQLVRALLNAATPPRNAIVADPMCGSGTTVAEAADAGFRAIGSDINPLSVLMARTKAELLGVSPRELQESYERIRAILLRQPSGRRTLGYLSTLPAPDQDYLRRWFSDEVLSDLDRIASAIKRAPSGPISSLFTLGLSNILRRVSWQKEDDLRVRREVRLDAEIDAVREFLEELGRTVRTVFAFLLQRDGMPVGSCRVDELDAREVFPRWNEYRGRVAVTISSPPYATALPYLDTDRLSLMYLGLLPRREHRRRDHTMIGNREITESMRRTFLEELSNRERDLPKSITRLIRKIEALNEGAADTGFRRRNMAALLTRYFLDMRAVLENVSALLKVGGKAYLVVGSNSTTAGGQHVRIDTAGLLSELGTCCGMRLDKVVSMEMLTSRDIFRRNASDAESVLCFSRG